MHFYGKNVLDTIKHSDVYNKRVVSGVQPVNIQGNGGFVEKGHLDKYFTYKTRKKARASKYSF